MQISHRMEDNVCVCSISENINTEFLNELREYIQPILENNKIQGLILNLSQVDFVDSSAMGMVIYMFKVLKERDAQLVLCHLNQVLQTLLRMSHLDQILTIYPTEAEALSHF